MKRKTRFVSPRSVKQSVARNANFFLRTRELFETLNYPLTFDVCNIFLHSPPMNEPNALTRWFPRCCFIIESCQHLANRKSIYDRIRYTTKLTDTTTYRKLIINRRINELVER